MTPGSLNGRLPRVVRALSLGGALVVALAACGLGAATPTPRSTADTSACPKAAPAALPAGEKRTVEIKTAKGSITIVVEADLGPLAAGNFVALASCGFYGGKEVVATTKSD